MISFDASSQKESLDKIGTRFHLDRSEMDLLVDEGRRMATLQLGALKTWKPRGTLSAR